MCGMTRHESRGDKLKHSEHFTRASRELWIMQYRSVIHITAACTVDIITARTVVRIRCRDSIRVIKHHNHLNDNNSSKSQLYCRNGNFLLCGDKASSKRTINNF